MSKHNNHSIRFSLFFSLICCAVLVCTLLTGASADVGSASICVGQTKSVSFTTGDSEVNSVSSSDASIVSASFTSNVTTLSGKTVFTAVVYMTGVKAGKATVTLYTGSGASLGSISVTVTNHNIKLYPAVEPTCTKEGSETCFTCTLCGKYFADVKGTSELAAPPAVPAKGHKIEVDAAKAETCTTDGLTEGSHCWVCGEILVKQETIPAYGHTVVVDPGFKATCTTDGLTEGKHCDVCHTVLVAQEDIPATGHTLTAHAKEDATCTKVGQEAYWTCSVCKKMFSDEAATTEIAAPVIIPAKGHTIVTDAAKAATATEKGLTEGKHCSTCGEVLIKQKEILPTVSEFVKRCYSLILGRAADEGGLSSWTYRLANKTANAAEIVSGFLNSPEYKSNGNSSAETVEVLYNTMLDRPSDPEGKNGWVNTMNTSGDTAVINGFSGSTEFQAICNAYGISAGTVRIATETGLKAFIERCYVQALHRSSDEGGKNYWVKKIETKEQTPQQVATGFVMSTEMNAAQKATTDPDALLDSLYRLYLGREADEGGKAYWKDKLANGMTVEELNAGFANSAEFSGIVDSYGLK